jgi:peptide/nickel transport system substrate-binding protein
MPMPSRSRSAWLRAVVLLVALGVLAVLPVNLAAQAPDGLVRREVRIGIAGIPAALDPATAVEGAVPLIARQVFDTLVAYRSDSTDVEPALATRWTVSRDGLVWSFTLREGVRFHDGTPLSAADVAASFERHLKPELVAGAPLWSAMLRGVPGVVKDVRAADARTIQFRLAQPYAALLTLLAHPGFGVVRTVTAADGSSRLIGTGPYRVVDASTGRLSVEAVANHWSGGARAGRLVFLETGTEEHAEAEMDARSLDVWFPPGPPRRAEGAISIPGLRVGYLAFQTEKEPFSRKKIRQAVAAAIDPAVLALSLDRIAMPLPSLLPLGVWARREGSPVLGGTKSAVAALLAEGGWPKTFRPTLMVANDAVPPALPRIAESLQLMLEAAEIPIQIRVEPEAVVRAAREKGEHELLVAESAVDGGDPHLFLYPLSTSEGASKGPQASNFSFYRNPRLDDVLIRASQIAFRPERRRLYQRAQAMLADEVPWVPLYVRLVWAVARPEVRGLRLHPTGFHRLTTVALEGPS